MCYHKSLAQKEAELLAHYDASFQSITEELEVVEEKFSVLMRKDDRLGSLSLTAPNLVTKWRLRCEVLLRSVHTPPISMRITSKKDPT